jgi:hypothetical protein
VFLDDDDVFMEGALDRMRAFAAENPGRIGIFRMKTPTGRLVWHRPVLEYGCVGTPTMIVPNVPGELGEWVQTEKGCDWNFLQNTLKLHRKEPVFVDHVVAELRRHGEFASRLHELRFRLRLGSRLRQLVSR